MDDSSIAKAAETIGGVIEDLAEVRRRLTAGRPLSDPETWARICDRLSEETAEAAAMIRAGR